MGDASAQAVARLVRRVVAARRLRRMSQAALGEHAGIDRSVIANIETGRRQDVRLKEALDLAEALDLSLYDLLSEEPLKVAREVVEI